MVRIRIGGQEIPFMVDTGAEKSVVTVPIAPPSEKTIKVIGATGVQEHRPLLKERICNLGKHEVTHQFLYLPDCPVALLGRDMLGKLQAQISFQDDGTTQIQFKGPQILMLTCPMEEEWRLYTLQTTHDTNMETPLWKKFRVPGVWAEDNPPGLAKFIPPVEVEIKPGARPVHVRQYNLPREAILGVKEHLERLIKYRILEPCTSPWNTPLIPVPKPGTTEYRPVQDLRLINQATVSIHPVVPNPYVLLGLIPANAAYFSVLDLKDAFFCIRLAKKSQPLFAFQWEHPTTGRRTQYCWTRLPQGFKNSPTLFGTALSQDLQDFRSEPEKRVLLQYVDDLLIASPSLIECWEGTQELLTLLAEKGYKVSRRKAQLIQQQVKYLGFHLSQGTRELGPERKETVCALPEPTTRKELRGFLGAAGFCRIWIPNFGLISRPLYESTQGPEKSEFVWTGAQQEAFKKLKELLLKAPALGLPDVTKSFTLYVHEQQNVAVGVLTQQIGSWQRPVAYLSKQLDPVAKGWPGCLKAIAATALLIKEADKLTFGQNLTVKVPHAVITLMDYRGNYWFTNSRMLKYQAMMYENPRINLELCSTLNPATLLPVSTDPPTHDCIKTMDEVYASRPDLKDVPWPSADITYYTDGSSFIHDGKRKAGYSVVTDTKTIEAKGLPVGTSAQKAELIALIRALELAAGLVVNIFTDSRYAFLTVHAHGALYKEKGLINSLGQKLKHGPEILKLLEVVWAPRKVAIMHCKGHQRGTGPVAKGNRRADSVAKQAALESDPASILAPLLHIQLSQIEPHYSRTEIDTALGELKAIKDGLWWKLTDGRIFVPQSMAWTVVQQAHRQAHLGKNALAKILSSQLYINGIESLTTAASKRCITCAKNNPRTGAGPAPGVQRRGTTPFEALTMDFTEMPRTGPYRYMLVFVCSYSGWPEAYPTSTERAQEVVRCLLKDVIPRHGIPQHIGSDNGPAFVHTVVDHLAKLLKITQGLHCAWRPQSSGQCERMNRFLKNQLAKITQESSLKWTEALPLALFHVRCTPNKSTGLSPYELMYGRPPLIIDGLKGDIKEFTTTQIWETTQALGKVLNALNKHVLAQRPPLLQTAVHPYQPGDQVWIKEWKGDPLSPKWRGPLTVLLSTPTALKIAGLKPWIHWTRVKPAYTEWTATSNPVDPLRITIRKTGPVLLDNSPLPDPHREKGPSGTGEESTQRGPQASK